MTVAGVSRRRRPAGDRSGRAGAVTALMAVLAAGALALSLGTGPTGLGLHDLAAYAAGAEIPDRERLILETVRLPRALLGALVGAGLAVSGVMMQGLFRNPLADPGLIGVSSGAGTAAVAMIVLSPALPAFVPALLGSHILPLAAFAGGLANTALLYLLATRRGAPRRRP